MCKKMVSKRFVLLSCIAMIVGIIATPTVFADTDAIILAVESARTNMSTPDDNTRDSQKLTIRVGNGDATRTNKSWIKFDISELYVSSLKTAILTLTLHQDRGPCSFDVSYVNDDCLDNIDWTGEDITWNNAPGNDITSEGDLDTDKTTLLAGAELAEGAAGVAGDTFTIDILEALESDTDGIVQFVLHNSSAYINIATHTHAEEAYRPFLSVIAGPKGKARNPDPATGTTDVSRDVILTWKPGANTPAVNGHNVYFSDSFDDVNDGVGGVTQDANDYAPGSPLDFGKTYYWRVDEANSVSGWEPGDIWSFTVEPEGYPLAGENITVTASSSATDPINTINGSGLDADDLHSNETADMWLSEASEPNEAWIQYEFDKVFKLYEMLVWNYNGESFLSGSGLKDVTVEYSSDGVNWIQINDVFAQAPGTAGYAPNTSVEFGGVAAKMVKITANSNWGTGALFNQYGLSEVQFKYIPLSARLPIPESGATDVALDATLSWKAGREAAEHNVYLSKDLQVVIDGTAPVVTVPATSYGPLSLDLGSMYYWRVDEVNSAGTVPIWEGSTWSFTTKEYLVVDDFESYNDIPEGQEGSNLVYLTWIDGYDNPSTNGSTMGYVTGSSMETSIVHNGRQSVPVIYDNTVASFSEVTASTSDLAVDRDWAIGSPEMLVLWVYGDPNNTNTDQMYVKVDDAKVTYDGELTQAEWQEVSVDLASLGINLSNVTSITIGFERIGATGGSGMVFIDDIWLYSPAAAQ